MRIAIIGIRGIPVVYSAFETFAQVLSTELVKKKHTVSVYCRSGFVSKESKKYKSVDLKLLPHIDTKNFSTLSHSFIATLHACWKRNYDVILYLGVGSTVWSIFPRLLGMKTMVHIDGMDWKRQKWGMVGRSFLKFSEQLTTFFPNAVITDSHYMQQYYKKRYKKDIHYIPYGYFENPNAIDSKKILKKYQLKKGKYFVWVGRLVPENHIEDFLVTFAKLPDTDIKSIILGDDIYESTYRKKVYALLQKDKRIIFSGFIPHEEVLVLEASSLAYVETKRSGGTHISLIEAMGVGSLIVSHAHQANNDVLGEAGVFYNNAKKSTSLTVLLDSIMSNPVRYNKLKKLVKIRAKNLYVWEKITSDYEKLFSTQSY